MKCIILIVIVNLITASSTLIGQSRLDYVKELMSKQRIVEAISVCQTYLQSSSRDENAWFLLAKAYQQIGNLDSAEIAAAKAVQLEDELLDGYTLLAEIQLTKKNLNEAYQTASSGLKISKKLNKQEYSPLLFVLGDILYEADSLDAALVAFSKVVEFEPNNAHAYERRGDVYLKQRVAPMAISQYERSLDIDSSQQQLLYKLANVYAKERQYADAARTV